MWTIFGIPDLEQILIPIIACGVFVAIWGILLLCVFHYSKYKLSLIPSRADNQEVINNLEAGLHAATSNKRVPIRRCGQ